MISSPTYVFAQGMILCTWSTIITGRFHLHTLGTYKKKCMEPVESEQEVIIIRVCGTRASWGGDYSPLHPFAPSFSVSLSLFYSLSNPPTRYLWITFNLQSKQLWQGLWSFDGRQREAGRKWVWGNEAAMSRNDLWTAPFPHSPFTETESV